MRAQDTQGLIQLNWTPGELTPWELDCAEVNTLNEHYVEDVLKWSANNEVLVGLNINVK